MDTIVLMPTIHRPEGLRRSLQSLKDTCGLPAVVVADPDDKGAQAIAKEFGANFTRTQAPKLGGNNAWNCALMAEPNHEAYFLGSDDVQFMPGWYEAVLRALDSIGGDGFVGTNDTRWGRDMVNKICCTHYLMTRKFMIEHNGGVAAVPFYFNDWTDYETDRRARKAKKWIWAEDAVVKHLWGGPRGDPAYAYSHSQRPKYQAIHADREKRGYPNDFKAIIK